VNVIGTAFFLIAVGFVALTTFLGSRANRPLPPPDRDPAKPSPAVVAPRPTTLPEAEA
jgi:hypothetical protein